MKILNCKQGSTEWALARAGVVTASEVDALVTPLFEPRKGEGVKTYLYRKAAERVMGQPVDSGGTFAMDQGNVVEKIARPWYAFKYNVEVETVGFCLSDDGKTGCSPDGLIGKDSGLEIKCPQPPTHCKYLLEQRVPPDYLAQLHMSMYVTGRPMWVFVSYSPYLPPLVVHVLRDDAIQAKLRDALAAFIPQLDEAETRIRGMMPKGGRE